MVENQTSEAQIAEWLRRNGYALEMTVARRVIEQQDARLTLEVQQGLQYVDVATGKLRESDVHWSISDVSYRQREDLVENAIVLEGHSHSLVFPTECQGTQSPWILFRGPGAQDAFCIGSTEPSQRDCAECVTYLQAFSCEEYPQFAGRLRYSSTGQEGAGTRLRRQSWRQINLSQQSLPPALCSHVSLHPMET